MAKHLNLILKKYSDVISGKLPASKVGSLSLGDQPGVDYAPKSQGDRDFVASHSVEMHPDRNGNGEDVFKASNMKMTDSGRHGHIPSPKDERVYKQANEEVEFSEKKDEGEYGYEGDMAITQLKTICRHGEHLIKMLKPDTDLPEWVQSKITKAEDYISTAHDYLMSEMTEEVEHDDEGWHAHREMHGKKGVSKEDWKKGYRLNSKGERVMTKKSPEKKQVKEEIELEEGGSQYRSAAGSGKNTNPNLSKLARKLAMEKPRTFRAPGESSKEEKREMANKLISSFYAKGGKVRKEELELDEGKSKSSDPKPKFYSDTMRKATKFKDTDVSKMIRDEKARKAEKKINEASIEDPTIVARKKQMDKQQQTHQIQFPGDPKTYTASGPAPEETHEIEFADKPGQKFTAQGKAPETHEIEFADKPGQKFTAMGAAPKTELSKSTVSAPFGIGSDGKPYQSSIYPDDATKDPNEVLKQRSSGATYNPQAKTANKKIKDLFQKLKEAKCNMTEAGTMCEVHGMKACSKEETASDKEPRYNGKDKAGKRKLLTDKNLQEKAESVAQQKLMAIALAFKRGEMKDASPEAKKLASTMTEKQLRDYAKTKHEGLPQHVQKEQAPAVTPITFPVTNSREGFKL